MYVCMYVLYVCIHLASYCLIGMRTTFQTLERAGEINGLIIAQEVKYLMYVCMCMYTSGQLLFDWYVECLNVCMYICIHFVRSMYVVYVYMYTYILYKSYVLLNWHPIYSFRVDVKYISMCKCMYVCI